MKVTMEVEGVEEFLQGMDGAYALFARERGDLIVETAAIVEEDAEYRAPVFTGALVKGIKTKVSPSRASAAVIAKAPHAAIIGRVGRRPGARTPPSDKLEYWRLAKGIKVSAYALARAIARKGIIPKPFLDDAWAAQRPSFVAAMERLVDRFVNAVSGRG